MTIQECYEKLGGNYDDVISRLRKEDFVKKFLKKFPSDPSFDELVTSMEAGDKDVAFRAAHTLKGVCQNLGLERLFVPSNEATEALRVGDIDKAQMFMPQIKEIYGDTLDTINEFVEEEE